MNALTAYLEKWFDEVEPKEFYRDIFPDGELQEPGEYTEGVYNGIAVAVTDELKEDGRTPKIRRYTVTNDLSVIDTLCGTDFFCLMSPITYAGKERTAENARFLYAFVVDLDRIRINGSNPVGLGSLWERHIEMVGRIPKPTYIVSSGTGLHLYYVLERPIALYSQKVRQLQRFKYALTNLVWHDTICDIKSRYEIQQEGIFQGFRVVGTITKVGDRARAFLTGDKVSMEYLNGFVDEASRVSDYLEKGALTRQRAKELYPDWYERRVVKKEPRGTWHVSRNLYEWWRRQILTGATVGHRYYCIMMLAAYAQKCSMYDAKHNPEPVTLEELEHDAWELFDFMEQLTNDEKNHFTRDDVLKALDAFNEKFIRYPRRMVEIRSGITIPENRRRKHPLKRDDGTALKAARMIQDLIYPDGEWRNKYGRPTLKSAVVMWRVANPEGKKADCIRELKIDRKTVTKYWEAGKREGQDQ